jgi:maltose O-acetyltransferase
MKPDDEVALAARADEHTAPGKVVFDTRTYLPAQGFMLKLASAFPWLLYLRLSRWLVHRVLVNVENCRILPGFSAVVGKNIHARDVHLGGTRILDYADVRIGAGTQFGGENVIITSTHALSDFRIVEACPVTIGRNVWITERCIILGGVEIGDNTVIGAGSVVTRSIPANVLAAGNPCKVVRSIQRGKSAEPG